jgi:cytochrome P450
MIYVWGIVALAVTVFAAYIWITLPPRLRYADGTELPSPPVLKGAWALFLGNIAELKVDEGIISQVFEKWCKLYGPTLQMRSVNRRVIITRDPELMRQIAFRRPTGFTREHSVHAAVHSILGGTGLFNAEGNEWSMMRKMTAPAFTKRLVADKSPVVEKHMTALVDKWKSAPQPIDPLHDCAQTTVQVILQLVFGLDTDASARMMSHSEKMFKAMSWRLWAPFQHFNWIRTSTVRAENAAAAAARADISELIADLKRQGESRETMLSALLDDASLSERDIIANVTTFVLAGSETTGHVMAWTPYILAENTDMQERLRTDLLALKQKGEVLYSSPLVLAIVRELLRLKTSTPQMGAECAVKQTLTTSDGRVLDIAPGTLCVSLYREANLFEPLINNAKAFDPYRWLTADETQMALLQARQRPFGDGPRVCPGQNLAYLELQHFVAQFLCTFRSSLVPGAPPATERLFFTSQPHGALVRLQKL